MNNTGISAVELFLEHVQSVLKLVGSRFPNVKLIMWDDMLREIPTELIKGKKP